MQALVTDVHTRSAVAGLRALGRAGIATVAFGPSRAAGLWSRHAAARQVGPDVIADPVGFAEEVARIATQRGPLVVYPVQEESMEALLPDSSRLPAEAVIPYADRVSVLALRDKRTLGRAAQEAGVLTPTVYGTGSAPDLLSRGLPTPCVVKAAIPEKGLALTHVVRTEPELEALLADVSTDHPLLVQEHVTGPLMAISIVVDADGGLRARFQQEARRTWPADAGSSRLAVSVAADEELAAAGARLLAGAGYSGLAQLQFIKTPRGPVLVDVNPRFYGSLPLAVACGVNLAAVWHEMVTGGPACGPEDYRLGVSYRWLEADLLAARRGAPGLLLQRAPRPSVGAMWASDDPIPGAILAARALGLRVAKRLGRHRPVLS
jgi:predicted ATP-grasp superfamily ATP-dependent carboligase